MSNQMYGAPMPNGYMPYQPYPYPQPAKKILWDTKKILCLVSIVMLFLFSLCMFMPIMVEHECWTRSGWYGSYTLSYSYPQSMFGGDGLRFSGMLFILVDLLSTVTIYALVLEILEKKQFSFQKYLMWAPALSAVLFAIGSYLEFDYREIYSSRMWEKSPAFGFYIACIFLAVPVVMCILMALGKIKSKPVAQSVTYVAPAYGYAPQQPQYAPQQPQYAPQQPQYAPQQPQYAPQQPQYAPQQAQYAPQQAQYVPQQAQYVPQQPQAPATGNHEELIKLKQLLDCGAITPEEFEAKKKQLLGM